MASSAQTCTRILSALEELVGQEVAVLRTGDYSALVEIQSRAEPLVSFLRDHAETGLDDALKARLVTLHAMRKGTVASLHAQMARNRAELRAISGRQRVVAQMAPAYGSAAAMPSTLSLVG